MGAAAMGPLACYVGEVLAGLLQESGLGGCPEPTWGHPRPGFRAHSAAPHPPTAMLEQGLLAFPALGDTRETPLHTWTQAAPSHRAVNPPKAHSGGSHGSQLGSSCQAGAADTEAWPPTQQGAHTTRGSVSCTRPRGDWAPGKGSQRAFYVL